MNRTDEGQNRGTIMKEAEVRAAAIASMKRKTEAHGYDGGASRVGYRQAPPDKKGMSNDSRGGEADHAADGSRGVLGELGNRQRLPIEPIRMSGHALDSGREMGPHMEGLRAEDEEGKASRDTSGYMPIVRPPSAIRPANWDHMSRQQRKHWKTHHRSS